MREKTGGKIAVRAVKVYISKSILLTYVRFSHARSQINVDENQPNTVYRSKKIYKYNKNAFKIANHSLFVKAFIVQLLYT